MAYWDVRMMRLCYLPFEHCLFGVSQAVSHFLKLLHWHSLLDSLWFEKVISLNPLIAIDLLLMPFASFEPPNFEYLPLFPVEIKLY